MKQKFKLLCKGINIVSLIISIAELIVSLLAVYILINFNKLDENALIVLAEIFNTLLVDSTKSIAISYLATALTNCFFFYFLHVYFKFISKEEDLFSKGTINHTKQFIIEASVLFVLQTLINLFISISGKIVEIKLYNPIMIPFIICFIVINYILQTKKGDE